MGAGERAYSCAKALRKELTWCRGEARYVGAEGEGSAKSRVERGARKDAGMDNLNIWYFRSKQSGPHYKTSYSREDLYFFPHLITSLRI